MSVDQHSLERVLISSGWLGGAGGAERALHSITRALHEGGVQVGIVARQRRGGPLAVLAPGIRADLATDVRWWGAGHTGGAKGVVLQALVNPLRRVTRAPVDAYLQFLSGASLGRACRANARLLIPSGNAIDPVTAARFDAIAMQAPDNQHFVPPAARSVLLPPPVFDLWPTVEKVTQAALPREFVLTVFNPYARIKGTDDVRRAADASPHPIVWCHSEATARFEIPAELRSHPRIVHVVDATPGQLRLLYERCSAYVSFSLTEGFGWSAADALRYSPAVITRPIGLFSDPGARQPGVTLTNGDIDWDAALAGSADPHTRDLSVIDGEGFPARLARAIRSLG